MLLLPYDDRIEAIIGKISIEIQFIRSYNQPVGFFFALAWVFTHRCRLLLIFFCSENEVTTTLSSLVDMPHQTRLVELLIASPEVNKQKIKYLSY